MQSNKQSNLLIILQDKNYDIGIHEMDNKIIIRTILPNLTFSSLTGFSSPFAVAVLTL
jgi:hypothetical protein